MRFGKRPIVLCFLFMSMVSVSYAQESAPSASDGVSPTGSTENPEAGSGAEASPPETSAAPEENAQAPTSEPAADEADIAEFLAEEEPEEAKPAEKEKKKNSGKMEAELPEHVVSASRTVEKIFRSERSLDIITEREAAERLPRTVPEALRESTGVFVQQTNLGGGSPIVRGMVGPQILLLVDGVRLNNSVYRTGPLQYLNLLDVYQIRRLEVVRGAGSVLYGSDALGATINLVGHEPADRRTKGFGANGRAGVKYGSAAREKTVHALADVGYEGLGISASASLKDFDNMTGGRGVGEQPYTGYRQVNASGKLSYRLREGFVKDWRMDVGYYLARMYDVGRAEKLESKDAVAIYRNEADLVYAKGHLIFRPIHTAFDIGASYQRFYEGKDSNQLDPSHDTIMSQTRDRIEVDTIGLDAQFTTRLFKDRFRLVYGLEMYSDFVDSGRKSRDLSAVWEKSTRTPFPKGSKYRQLGAYLAPTGELLPLDWDWNLKLTVGYRIQQMHGEADAREDAQAVDYSNLAHVFMAGLQTSYKSHWMTAFTWSQGFRAPNLQESVFIGDTGEWYHIANNDLGPERSDTLEWLTRFDAWRLRGSLTGYVTFLSDLIRREETELDGETEIMGKSVARNVNGGKGRLYGVEAELEARLGYGLSLINSVTYAYGTEWLTGEDKQKLEMDRMPLSKIPPVFGESRLRWENRKIHKNIKPFAETYLLWAAKQDRLSEWDKGDVRIPEGGTLGWVTWNLRGGADLYDHVRVGLLLENLTNTKYKYHASGVYGAGTNAVLTLEGRF